MTRVVVSSASDISKKLSQQYGVGVAQCDVLIEERSFKDWSLSPDDLYSEIDKGKTVKTSAPSPGTYINVINDLLSDGEDNSAVILALPRQYSHDITSAEIAASQLKEEYKKDIEVVDSKLISAGLALAAIKVSEALKQYREKMREQIDHILNRTRIYASLDDTSQLQKSGRINFAQHYLASLLNIKPVLSLNKKGDVVPVARSRSYKGAMKRIIEHIEEDINCFKPSIVHYMLMHGNVPEKIEELGENISKFFKERKIEINLYAVSRVGSAIGTHGGPTLYGIALFLE